MADIASRSLIGRAVVSVADGEKAGEISDVHLDLDTRTVLGFAVGGSDSLFHKEAPLIVPFSGVQNIGPQAVTVTDNAQVLTGQEVPATVATLERLRKRVVSEGGEVVGDGNDVIFDPTTGAITGFQLVPQGGFLGVGATTRVIPIADVVGFGRDVITVRSTAQTKS